MASLLLGLAACTARTARSGASAPPAVELAASREPDRGSESREAFHDFVPPETFPTERTLMPMIAPWLAGEGLFAVSGVITSMSSEAPGHIRVTIGPAPTPMRCASTVTLPRVDASPQKIGVDGTPLSGLVIDHRFEPAPALAVGDRICGLVHFWRSPQSLPLAEAILVKETGRLIVAYSDTATMAIPGWTFTRGAPRIQEKVRGGEASWRTVEVAHGGVRATTGGEEWPVLEARDGRYRVIAFDYEKEGELLYNESPAIRAFAITRLGAPGG